jgi:hypothetical protein
MCNKDNVSRYGDWQLAGWPGLQFYGVQTGSVSTELPVQWVSVGEAAEIWRMMELYLYFPWRPRGVEFHELSTGATCFYVLR